MISIKSVGKFEKLIGYLNKSKELMQLNFLDEYGKKGVNLLSLATPKDTGLTASSWSYEINRSKDSVSLSFKNSNIQNGVPIAIILQYGHATRNGGWVEGIDYINPTIRPLFEQLAEEAWREVKSV